MTLPNGYLARTEDGGWELVPVEYTCRCAEMTAYWTALGLADQYPQSCAICVGTQTDE